LKDILYKEIHKEDGKLQENTNNNNNNKGPTSILVIWEKINTL